MSRRYMRLLIVAAITVFMINGCILSVFAEDTPSVSSQSVEGIRINLSNDSYVYNGRSRKPAVKVILNGRTLKSSNYKVRYYNNVNAGTATVSVTCVGNYAGSVKSYFTICKAPNALNAELSRSAFNYRDLKKSSKYSQVNVAKSNGRITYSSSSKYLNVSNSGKVTLRKGTPRGSYTVSVKASGDSNHRSKKLSLNLKVK